MTQENGLNMLLAPSPLLLKRLAVGAAIGLALMALFLLPIKTPHPEWGDFWMIRPFVVITFAGAAGGFCYHLLDILRQQSRGKKIVANILASIIYIIGLFLGFVLCLDGTLWN